MRRFLWILLLIAVTSAACGKKASPKPIPDEQARVPAPSLFLQG